MEVGVVGLQMQVLAKDVATLAIHKIVQEQVQVGEDLGKTFVADVDRIEVGLDKTILMIENKKM